MNNFTIDLTKCNLSESELIIAKVAIKGNKEVGVLRSSKPKTPKQTVYEYPIYPDDKKFLYDSVSKYKTPNCYATEEERIQGLGSYVWRELAFCISKNSTHHCMPVCNDFNLEYGYSDIRRKEQEKMCQEIVNKVLKTIPNEEKYGLNRWGRVLGF